MKFRDAKIIQQIYHWIRIILLVAVLLLLGLYAKAQTSKPYMPQFHGVLRGKYEYATDMKASRFELRNARVGITGKMPLRSEYKLEVDFHDENEMKIKDAWVRLIPWRTLRISLGQQRLPFSIDAHRNPSSQYFANRSFIGKQVGDMRDVGGMVGYTFLNKKGRPVAILDAGIFNGANITQQKSAWHTDVNYSARLQFFPITGLALVPSLQHDAIAERQAHYTSLDFGVFFARNGWHVEAEFLHKRYMNGAFDDCSAVNAMLIYKQKIRKENSFIQSISYLGRYDYMGDHSNGKKGFVKDEQGNATSRLALTDAERHRMTLGVTFSVRNPHFPTDIRLNYENYWYPHGGADRNETDKLVAEVAIWF